MNVAPVLAALSVQPASAAASLASVELVMSTAARGVSPVIALPTPLFLRLPLSVALTPTEHSVQLVNAVVSLASVVQVLSSVERAANPDPA